MEKEKKNYAKREVNEYTLIMKIFYYAVTKIYFNIKLHLMYKINIKGLENVPKDNKYIVCPNHLSNLDPPLMGMILKRPISFMAKQELFENPILGKAIYYLGGFAVNREHLGVSTIKTAKSICKTDWVLGLFPQGTREVSGTINRINKGFVTLAKATKCGILPIGIVGTDNKSSKLFSGKIDVNIGEIIPYNDDLDVMAKQWIESIQKLTGFEYKEEIVGGTEN